MRQLFNDNWEFLEMPLGTELAKAQTAAAQGTFAPVRIPHDWMIGDSNDLYRDATGWYRKCFDWKREEGQRIFLIFDGVYMDSAVYLNGHKLCEWKYGYTRFQAELTETLRDGENELMVSASCQQPNSRWYAGGGINRNVWLMTTADVCIPDGGIYASAQKTADDGWDLRVEIRLDGSEKAHSRLQPKVQLELLDMTAACGETSAASDESEGMPAGDSASVPVKKQANKAVQPASVKEADPQAAGSTMCRVLHYGPDAGLKRWDIDDPALYTLKVTLTSETVDGENTEVAAGVAGTEGKGSTGGTAKRLGECRILQQEEIRIGFRETAFDPEKGFFLNGRHVKLGGACQHPDLGALGTAFHEDALRRQYEILKGMGVNAIRFAHNPFASEALDLADEMGLVVMDEAFDMWERSKTEYDYGRFFNEWQARDIESFVCRDRNHPCLILWSIGNEIYDQHVDAERGYEISKMLMDEVHALDPYGNGAVTTGSNYMPWENAQHCADLYKLAGYNYSEKYYEPHHAKYPDWVIYGSETSSICMSRGIYHFPLKAGILADEDEQCSALGNSVTSWGAKSMEDCVAIDRDLTFSMGQFLWSGFDYIGEPTPYHTKNSYLGIIDTAGFPKDAYYVWESAWTDVQQNPMVHVFPYWNFNEGQEIDLRVCSNASEVELVVNGKSLGRQTLDHAIGSGHHLIADWHVTYEPGEITAIAYENGQEVARQTRHSFGNTEHYVVQEQLYGQESQGGSRIRRPEEGGRLHFYEISAVDADGYPVENAADRVKVSVSGGRLVGLDNGDSTDYDSYQASERNLFSGKLLAIVEETTEDGQLANESLQDKGRKNAETPEAAARGGIEVTVTRADRTPVRQVILHAEGGQKFTAEQKVLKARAEIAPAGADDQEIVFSAVDDNGVVTNIVQLEPDGNEVVMTALGDGSFHLRATSKGGTEHVRLISQIEYQVEGLGPAYLDPYGFISGSLYTGVIGEVGNGNEKGVATSRDGETVVTWSGIDFGPVGSDEITIPIFALSGEEYPLEIWEGVPGEEGAELLASEIYCKPCIWNVYQPETYHLAHRLKGLASFSIRVHQKIHIKGFSFTKLEKAWTKLYAGETDGVYGDSFRRDGLAVRGIGNNVSLLFKEMDFAEHPLHGIRIAGSTPLAVNTIHVRFYDGTNEEKEIIEFRKDGGEVQEFTLPERSGKWDLTFVFLPGSNFDFEWFQLF